MNLHEIDKYQRMQNRLFYWNIAAFVIFTIAEIASIFRHLLGFDPHWAGDNFVFNILFLFPVTIICLLISYITGELTIGLWRKLPDNSKSIITLILTISLIGYVIYYYIMLLRQH